LRDAADGDIMNRKLSQPELQMALENLPPVLIPQEAAELLRLKLSTLYRHVSEGRYAGAVKRGKPLRFWRDRLVQEFMR
jgi:excisionase family DNA binding protein